MPFWHYSGKSKMIRRTNLWTWQRCSLDTAPAAGESPVSSASALHSFSTHTGSLSIAFPLRRHLHGVSKPSPSFNYFLPPCTAYHSITPSLCFPPLLLLFFIPHPSPHPCAPFSPLFLTCSSFVAPLRQELAGSDVSREAECVNVSQSAHSARLR